MRALGFLLFGMGIVLSLTTLLALVGIIPLQIDFFGVDLDTRNERLALVSGCVVLAVVGLMLLRISKRPPKRTPEAAA